MLVRILIVRWRSNLLATASMIALARSSRKFFRLNLFISSRIAGVYVVGFFSLATNLPMDSTLLILRPALSGATAFCRASLVLVLNWFHSDLALKNSTSSA